MTAATYFVSDVHLRADEPDRDRRFLAFIQKLTPADSLIIAGDLCDFWMGSRTRKQDLDQYPSLRALAQFSRNGGALAIMAGNHDLWLMDYYAQSLGASILVEPHDLEVAGLRIRLVHGHLLGARRRWKSFMESHAFFRLFGFLPGFLAQPLDQLLAWRNRRGLLADEERHLNVYRHYTKNLAGKADLVLIGHVHRPVDDAHSQPRMIVLGGWQHRTSFLRIDALGAHFQVIPDPPC